ncbi:MAG TPA: DUF3108 domain-containing protein [Nitrospiraceae bacterium]|nr:DUF3108 domain-containing protein [Nitrospiraceae bacterium]
MLFLSWAPSAFSDFTPRDPDAPSRPFIPGERLTYTLSWLNIKAGTAVMGVSEAAPIDGRPALRLLTTAKSTRAISKLYPIDNRVESLIDAETLSPYRMMFQRREGKQKNDFDVTFRHHDGTVVDIKDGVAETRQIPSETHDLVSCLYYVRSLPSVEPGSTFSLNLHHDKKNYHVEVRVEGMERVKAPWGEVEAIRVLVIMPFQGIFLNEGNIRVWLTHDARRIPLMMKAKVIIGSVVARLTEAAE